MVKSLAPVVLFAYKRLESLQKTVDALQKNFLAKETELIVFADGPKNQSDKKKVALVQNYIDKIDGFKNVTVKKYTVNRGLSKSIKAGVSEVLTSYKSVIVVEDDLLTTPNFLNFMNQALQTYEYNEKINSISGYTFALVPSYNYGYDNFFNLRASSWGWATWANRWSSVNWEILDCISRSSIKETKKFGTDFPSLIQKAKSRVVDSWAIAWFYFQLKNNLYTVYPIISKVQNIGFDLDATHTLKSEKRFKTKLDESQSMNFNLCPDIIMDTNLQKQFKNNFSYSTRFKSLMFYYYKTVFNYILPTRS
ncbi:glycosyltransferase [Chitinophagaceae bacterium LB-8]|uniref:Glycosyltransferase n=1 Tax=Paraflavisolibacter caeni TaxID=2982496 RepID=A0A9X3B8R6_9BACT|nr:glycosyltransferase [Paraflavisolibacter caeni]MCU7550101.1 glycosyltransferase [Paraflavisolibacter caeni]